MLQCHILDSINMYGELSGFEPEAVPFEVLRPCNRHPFWLWAAYMGRSSSLGTDTVSEMSRASNCRPIILRSIISDNHACHNRELGFHLNHEVTDEAWIVCTQQYT